MIDSQTGAWLGELRLPPILEILLVFHTDNPKGVLEEIGLRRFPGDK